ncbi:hypothetical protein [Flavobacterium seoulense]|uniref:Uncharacterized protein n=1 Tax=Flavobacterium seoulense TaxID=1492738 RepID=A0A066WJS0_9FLAO|nr:hypothetical protein [Flavobacterium seoulense]KDN54101.1 hypothetical protein FEM21_27540 [Flavobacterium seoulense]
MLLSSSSLYAHTLATTSLVAHSLKRTLFTEKLDQTKLEHLFDNQSSISDAMFETYQKKEILSSDSEEEDSETTTAKKAVEKQSCQLSFFQQLTTPAFIAYTKKTQAFCKELSYLPSRNSLYIIFEVFRI